MQLILPFVALTVGFFLGKGIIISTEFLVIVLGVSLVYWAFTLPDLLHLWSATAGRGRKARHLGV
jgi:hypothetical protein